MPPSAPELDEVSTPGQTLATVAEVLYLANLLLLPGLAFLVLLGLFLAKRRSVPPLAAAHLGQTLSATLWAGALLILANALILALGGYSAPETWVVLIVCFTVCHATLVLLGVAGLAKAMAGQCWRYPLVGRPLPRGCAR